MRKFLTLAALVLCVGCAGPKSFWKPDSLYTEHSTYDGDQLYNEVGVSGELGGSDIRMDIFAITYTDMHDGRDRSIGGGVRFEIPIGKKRW